jgi:hypothetical protein
MMNISLVTRRRASLKDNVRECQKTVINARAMTLSNGAF